MCAPALIPLIAAVVSTGASVYTAKKAEKAQERQANEQKQLADQQAAKRSDMEGGVINLDENTGVPSGLGNTFLTGAGGISNSQLNLGGANKTLGG